MDRTQRLDTLDIFRGLTIMLMILVNTPGSFSHVYPLLEHAPWIGCTLADLVFPFFLFFVGFSAFLSCKKYSGLTQTLLHKITRRTLLLFLLGILFNMYPYYNYTQPLSWQNLFDYWAGIRIFGILQRIACAYFVGVLLCLTLKTTRQILGMGMIVLFLSWLGYILYHPAQPYALDDNLSRCIDLWFPGTAHIYQGFGIPFDPEGLYGTFAASVSVMFGYLSGRLLDKASAINTKLVQRFYLWGGASLIAGMLLSSIIPICKALWTPSYVLFTTGIADILFGSLLYIFEIKKKGVAFGQPAKAFGRNPLFFFFVTAFVAQSMAYPWLMLQDMPIYAWIYQYIFINIVNPEFGSLLFGLVYLFFCWILAEILYRKHLIWKL